MPEFGCSRRRPEHTPQGYIVEWNEGICATVGGYYFLAKTDQRLSIPTGKQSSNPLFFNDKFVSPIMFLMVIELLS